MTLLRNAKPTWRGTLQSAGHWFRRLVHGTLAFVLAAGIGCGSVAGTGQDRSATAEIQQLRSYANQLQQELRSAEADLDRSRAARMAERESCADQVARLQREIYQLQDVVAAEIRSRERELRSLSARVESLRGAAAQGNERAQSLVKELESAEQALKSKRSEVDSTRGELKRSRHEGKSLRRAIEEEKERYAVERDMFRRRGSEVENLSGDLATARGEIDSLREELQEREKAIRTLRDEIARRQKRITELEQERSAGEVARLESLQRLEAKVVTAEASFEAAERERIAAEQACRTVERERNRLVTDLEALRQENAKLKARLGASN